MSKTVYYQINKHGLPIPYSQEDLDALKSYKPNQIIKGEMSGTRKQRSIEQNAWIHCIFKMGAENTDDPKLDTLDKFKRKVKMAMKFFKDKVEVIDNKVFFELRSFAFDQMEQDEANMIYEQAKIVSANIMRVDPEKLESQAKGRCRI